MLKPWNIAKDTLVQWLGVRFLVFESWFCCGLWLLLSLSILGVESWQTAVYPALGFSIPAISLMILGAISSRTSSSTVASDEDAQPLPADPEAKLAALANRHATEVLVASLSELLSCAIVAESIVYAHAHTRSPAPFSALFDPRYHFDWSHQNVDAPWLVRFLGFMLVLKTMLFSMFAEHSYSSLTLGNPEKDGWLGAFVIPDPLVYLWNHRKNGTIAPRWKAGAVIVVHYALGNAFRFVMSSGVVSAALVMTFPFRELLNLKMALIPVLFALSVTLTHRKINRYLHGAAFSSDGMSAQQKIQELRNRPDPLLRYSIEGWVIVIAVVLSTIDIGRFALVLRR